MRRRLSILTMVALVVSMLGVAASVRPAAATSSFKDTIPANGGSGPDDHGWFQGGLQWVGDFPDPTVVKVGSTYYAYSTPTGGRYLPILTSTDLRTWMIHPNWSTSGPVGARGYDVYADPAIPAEIRASGQSAWDTYLLNDGLVAPPSWGLVDNAIGPWLKRDYWAPGVIQIGSTWFAYGAVRTSTASDDPYGNGRFCLTVASASSPLGPFRDISGAGPIQCQSEATDPAGSIDPFPWQDPTSGRYYLLWKATGKVGVSESALMATEIGSNGFPTGGPVVKLLETDRGDPWEGSTIENPGMISFGGTTYLFYSANYWAAAPDGTSSYATGYAVCPSGPLGPCTRVQHTPLLFSFFSLQGPGGASPFIGPDGQLRVAYAAYEAGEPARPNGQHPRRLHIGVLARDPDGTLRYLGDEGNVPAPAAPPVDDLFHPIDPTRIIDSRPGTLVGPFTTPWGPGTTRDVRVAGVAGVPAGADAVALNITVSDTTAASYLTAWPTGQPRPTASNLNWSAGRTIPNAVTVKVGSNDSISLFSVAGSANVIVDVVGWYEDAKVQAGGAGFTPLGPSRLLDSRADTKVGPYSSPWVSGQSRTVPVAGSGGVPRGAEAVVLNVTVTDTTSESYLTVSPHGTARPTASNLNWRAGDTIANAVTVKLPSDGIIDVYSANGQADVIIDVVGYFDVGTGAAFHPLTPARVQDSRVSTGDYATPWGPGTARDIHVGGVGGVPANAAAVLSNVTVTNTTAPSYLTLWPSGSGRPTVSTLNWSSGMTIPNAATTRLGSSGQLGVYSVAGSVDVIVDVAGWYG